MFFFFCFSLLHSVLLVFSAHDDSFSAAQKRKDLHSHSTTHKHTVVKAGVASIVTNKTVNKSFSS